MNAIASPLEDHAYRCPGQQHPISRAVHLGRLAAFYPACRQCSHRDDTGTLSPRQVEQLQEVRSSNQPRSLFHDEGAGGVYLNELTPAAARSIAAAFGAVLRDERRDEGRRLNGGFRQGRIQADGISSLITLLIPNPQSLIPPFSWPATGVRSPAS